MARIGFHTHTHVVFIIFYVNCVFGVSRGKAKWCIAAKMGVHAPKLCLSLCQLCFRCQQWEGQMVCLCKNGFSFTQVVFEFMSIVF